jgi:hypothetical protein
VRLCVLVLFVDKYVLSTLCEVDVHLSYATDRPGLSVGRPVGMLAYFVSGFFYMVGYAYVTLCQEVVTSGEFVTPQGVIALYHFCVVVPTHVVLFMITFLGI